MINQKSKIHHRIHVPIYNLVVVRAFFVVAHVFIVFGAMLFIARKSDLFVIFLETQGFKSTLFTEKSPFVA